MRPIPIYDDVTVTPKGKFTFSAGDTLIPDYNFSLLQENGLPILQENGLYIYIN